MSEKFILTWEDVNNIVIDLCFKIAEHKHQKIGLIGISRGGLVPAVMMSHVIKTQYFSTIGISSYSNKQKKAEKIYQNLDDKNIPDLDAIYVVDDIVDTGSTFKYLQQHVFKKFPVKTVSLLYKKNNVFKPDYFGYEVDKEKWVDFPWELDYN